MKDTKKYTSTNNSANAKSESHFEARRRSLKTIAAGVAVPFAPLTFAGTAFENADYKTATEVPGLPAAQKSRHHDLELHIFSSRAVMEDSVLLRNNLTETVLLREIKPSIVVFNGRFVDLRRIVKPGSPLSLAPQHTVSFQVFSQPLYGRDWSHRHQATDEQELPDVIEYLWAESSVGVVSDDAVLVSTAAFIADETALLYVKPDQTFASAVQLS